MLTIKYFSMRSDNFLLVNKTFSFQTQNYLERAELIAILQQLQVNSKLTKFS